MVDRRRTWNCGGNARRLTAAAPSLSWGCAVAAEVPAARRPTPRQNQRLGRGVNVLGYDPIWKDRQKARFQEKYFRLIKRRVSATSGSTCIPSAT